MLTVLHICPAADWESVPEGGVYRAGSGSGAGSSLDDVGFIHCSDRGTVHLPATNLYAGRADLLLLEIDTAGLDVRWEAPLPDETEHGPWFPHIYEPVPADAVVAVHEFRPEPDGTFRLPEALTTPRPTQGFV